jgi:beta-lactamase class A
VAASTAKVLAAAAYYHLVETGAASLDDPLGSYTAGFQLREMIQQSDNDSWSLIMDAVGHEELTEYAASLGVSYDPESNTLTPAEMATILAGVYSGTLLTAGHTAQLLSFMQDTNYETLIPAAVPEGITVFHKYGLLDDELHDAAVLAQGNTAYALVIYTKGQGLSDVPERTDVIHQLTQAVADALF